MRLYGEQSVGWVAEPSKWFIKRPRLCWPQIGDPFSTGRTGSRVEGEYQVPGSAGRSVAKLRRTPAYRDCQNHPIWR